MDVINFDTSMLLSFYQSKLGTSAANLAGSTAKNASSTAASTTSTKNSATAKDVTPWSVKQPIQSARDAQVLNLKKFIDLSDVPVLAGNKADTKTEQDNQKLFALYKAVNNLSYLATMSKRDDVTTGLMAGYDARFQSGLKEIQDYLGSAKFNNFTLQSQAAASSITSNVKVPNPTFGYQTGTLVSNANLATALPGISSTDKFTIAVLKGGVTKNIDIDMSQVSGDLTLDHIIQYTNQQLSLNGVGSRFKKTITSGTIDKQDKATYGLQVDNAANENLTFTAAATAPALYISATTGLNTTTEDGTADNQGRLVKLGNLDDPKGEFSVNTAPTTGTTTATGTVVDSNGDIYVVGSATGDFGSQVNAGEQDAVLTKYDSAGQVLWTRMLGSAGSASGASLALNPNGGVTVVGTTNAPLSPTSVNDGNQDTFVTRYDSNGTQTWTTQIQTLNNNKGSAVSVDTSGNVYIGGQTTGSIGLGQAKIGGTDAYVAKLDNKGKVVYEKQFGTTANDSVAATALTSSGDLVVATVQDGHAILNKYAGGDATAAPAWSMDLGELQPGGTVTGLAVKDGRIYVTGTTQNANLNAGSATVAQASSGGTDAFLFAATDNGSSVTADTVSYLGTSAAEKGGAVTVASDGTVFVTGTTSGTFAGQTRNQTTTDNMFVASLKSDGTTNWVRQYGGLDGQSSGTGIAISATGSSVLDALGLPSGKLPASKSSDLLSATTLRPGDSFKMKIDSTSDRTFTITIDKGESLQSLVTKMNGQLWGAGKASVVYGGGGSSLKIEVKPGVNATLIAGPNNLDALKRLGLAPGVLSNAETDPKKKPTDTSHNETSTNQTFSLGLASKMSIATSVGASTARAQLLSVLSAIQKAYQTTNTPSASTSATGGSGGGASAFTQNQLASYGLANSILGGSTSLLG